MSLLEIRSNIESDDMLTDPFYLLPRMKIEEFVKYSYGLFLCSFGIKRIPGYVWMIPVVGDCFNLVPKRTTSRVDSTLMGLMVGILSVLGAYIRLLLGQGLSGGRECVTSFLGLPVWASICKVESLCV